MKENFKKFQQEKQIAGAGGTQKKSSKQGIKAAIKLKKCDAYSTALLLRLCTPPANQHPQFFCPSNCQPSQTTPTDSISRKDDEASILLSKRRESASGL